MSGIVRERVRRDAGRLIPETPIAELRSRIADRQEIVIFDKVYPAADCLALRRAITGWGEATEPWPQGVSASRPGTTFHRLDDGSVPTKMPHIFHQYGFADLDPLPAPLAATVGRLRAELIDLQNQLAGTDFGPATDEFRAKALRHPRGGGHLVAHVHPYEPARVALFLNLSEPGTDYASGAAQFHTAGHGWVDTHDEFRIGDVLAWRYDLVHGVSAVEPGGDPIWEGDDGLWIFAMEWVESHPKSGPASA